jgi:hypothetical protein
MRTPSKILLALTAVAALSVAYPAKANLIQNGGFEDGNFNHWSTGGGVSVEGTFDGVAPHSGSFQAVITDNASLVVVMYGLSLGVLERIVGLVYMSGLSESVCEV